MILLKHSRISTTIRPTAQAWEALSSNSSTGQKTKQKHKGEKERKNHYLVGLLVVYAYNPSDSGDRDQEDSNSKPDPWANNSTDTILKKLNTKKVWLSGSW
jgi:hypothetical protein